LHVPRPYCTTFYSRPSWRSLEASAGLLRNRSPPFSRFPESGVSSSCYTARTLRRMRSPRRLLPHGCGEQCGCCGNENRQYSGPVARLHATAAVGARQEQDSYFGSGPTPEKCLPKQRRFHCALSLFREHFLCVISGAARRCRRRRGAARRNSGPDLPCRCRCAGGCGGTSRAARGS
jgi:hypothetical protein